MAHAHPTGPITARASPVITALGRAVYAIRWGLVPLYVGLWVAVLAYIFKFCQYLWFELVLPLPGLDIEELMLRVVNLVDMGMVAALVVIICIGSYSIFVKEYKAEDLPDRPRWIRGLTSMTLKVKMGVSLIGVSSVHLLTTFMKADEVTIKRVLIETGIHLLFVITTVGYCYVDKLMHANEPHEPSSHHPVPETHQP